MTTNNSDKCRFIDFYGQNHSRIGRHTATSLTAGGTEDDN